MVRLSAPFFGAAAALALVPSAFAAPSAYRIRDSAVNEPAVSAPNGIIESTLPMATMPPAVSMPVASVPAVSMPAVTMPAVSMMSAMSSKASTMTVSKNSTMSLSSKNSTLSMATKTSTMSMATMTSKTSTMSMATMTSSSSMAMPTYGSGSTNWGTDLNSCIAQCQARFALTAQPTVTMPASTATMVSSHVTHTIVVAPTQGVLRYVPFAVNASVGDTVSFQWHAGPHTVTKSSELTICNKTMDMPFASGLQNASFIFNQVVNDTTPTFYYCGVPTHCEKGMFGIINPPSAYASSDSAAMMIPAMASTYAGMMSMWNLTQKMTMNTTAASWGASMNMSGYDMPTQSLIAENIMYTRNFYAMNPAALAAGTGAAGSSLMFPAEITTANANMTMNSTSMPMSMSGTMTGSAAMPTKTNGAGHVVTSGAVLAGVALFASAILL